MKSPESGSANTSTNDQASEGNPANAWDDMVPESIPEAPTSEAEEVETIGVESTPEITQLSNETATDRTPDDTISPETDASVNPFEDNPDDSTDITAEFNDEKAQEIEQQLETKAEQDQPLGPILDVEDDVSYGSIPKDIVFEPILDVEEGAEHAEATPGKEDYEEFSSYYFASLCDQLDDPHVNQQRVYEAIAVLPNLINLLSDVDLSNPREVFQSIIRTYEDLAQQAVKNGREDEVKKQKSYALAAGEMAPHFLEFMRKRPHMPAEKHSDDQPVATDPNNPLTSGPMLE